MSAEQRRKIREALADVTARDRERAERRKLAIEARLANEELRRERRRLEADRWARNPFARSMYVARR